MLRSPQNISLTVKVKSFHDFFAQQNFRHLEIANINCRTKHQNFRLKNLPDTGKFLFRILKKSKMISMKGLFINFVIRIGVVGVDGLTQNNR